MNITLEPDNHTFEVLPQESLLDAALRAGANVRYQCNNGSCGQCRARLMAGTLAPLFQADRPLSSDETAAGMCLMCCNGVSTSSTEDVVLNVARARSPADVPVQKISVKFYRVQQLTEEIVQIDLRTPRSKTLWFLAGQSVNLKLGDAVLTAAVASCPCNGMLLQFHLSPKYEHVHALLAGRAKKGLTLDIEGPFGTCTLNEASPGPAVFVCIDEGFAAAKSIIEHAVALDWPQPVRLYWLRDRLEERYLENYCRSWADALEDYCYLPVETDAVTALKTLSCTEPSVFDTATFYLAGNARALAGIHAVLADLGVPEDRRRMTFTDRA